MGDETFASMKRSKMGRKKRVRKVVKPKATRVPEQMSLPQAEKKIIDEKAAWKGGLTAKKNIPSEWDD